MEQVAHRLPRTQGRVPLHQALHEARRFGVGMALGAVVGAMARHPALGPLVALGAGLCGLGLFVIHLWVSNSRRLQDSARRSDRRTRRAATAVKRPTSRARHARRNTRVRPQGKAAQLRSEEHFRTITEGLPIPAFLTRAADGQILYANTLCGPGFGLPLEALVGRPIVDFYDDPTERRTMLEALRRTGTLYDHELHFRRADGTHFWGLTSLHSLTFNGEPAVIEWIYDISTYKHTKTTSAQAQDAA